MRLLHILSYYAIFKPYSETTKGVLIASTYIHLKRNEFVKYASDLPTLCPRILLSGPAGLPLSLFIKRDLLSIFFFLFFWSITFFYG